MIEFESFALHNGLKIVLQHDNTTPFVQVNMLYHVGSKDEQTNKTGFAHLFEHLMFRGSENVADFSKQLAAAGGFCNAYTTQDYTLYFSALPKENIETALWLESDRMLNLKLDEITLNTEKKVVIEEFKENYLNQPYGDLAALIHQMAFEHTPYEWLPIGKDIQHIETADLKDVQDFFKKFYTPQNATLLITGNYNPNTIKQSIEQWFGEIPAGEKKTIAPPLSTPIVNSTSTKNHNANVPSSVLVKFWKTDKIFSETYYAAQLIAQTIGQGEATLLYQKLVKENPIFSTVSMQINEKLDNCLLVFVGLLKDGADIKTAEKAVENVLTDFQNQLVESTVLEKIINTIAHEKFYQNLEISAKSHELAKCLAMGNIEAINDGFAPYEKFTPSRLRSFSKTIMHPKNTQTLYYNAATI